MPRSNNDKVPCHYVRQGTWPFAVLEDDAPVSAHRCQELAQNLAHAMAKAGHRLRPLANSSGVHHTTIARLLQGKVLPDIGTLARLEDALDHRLWPMPHDRHRPTAERPAAGQRAAASSGTDAMVGLHPDDLQRLPDAEYIAFLNALGSAFQALTKDPRSCLARARSVLGGGVKP
ncbi:helix-turn-helix domain-containing protein [Streptomyces botrytidirepellens]|uniref:XRE family transcriptional regulator n=1 Tax=Streptomyces botrytidirepellens TaxID=2486417 RepID=A0A3M8WUU8_9ACTN|nr:helix-turn-helix transcriptional regulator [Streptomyces botrytidirepellens]RNG33507.1 XRE family transcriptional regulator [Streptomyces botrytidirepellens]